ncbi:pathogenesis-related protein STH-2-like [Silene latifolia]|uniref:pathogenesis-related protein STH-2-like n=1 Tax=Silene latifolia TaxID=37657 RepID=UPI003D76E00B
MGVSTHTMVDCTSPVAAARLFNAFCIDNHNFMPKALPNFVKSVDVVHGEPGTVGSVRQLNFPEGKPFKYAKNRVDEIDAGKFYCKYTTIEGDVLRENIEYVVHETTFEPSGNGTHYTMVTNYHTKGDFVVTDEHVAAGKQNIKKMFDTASEYLAANPHLYA